MVAELSQEIGRSPTISEIATKVRLSEEEVLEGLDPGERVITSPYTGFVERDRLSLSGQ